MSFTTKFSNGWTIASSSFKVLRENRKLILFPILSSLSLLLIVLSFGAAVLGYYGWHIDNISDPGPVEKYGLMFLFYIVNYFVIVFFNMALIHCSSLYFKGEEVTLQKGIQFSMSRVGTILGWAVFAGIVGTVLRIIQENAGSLGKILTGLIGIVWSIATFFVVPVIAYENLDPLAAFKRSASLMKQKWGESIGATFNFGLIQLGGLLAIGVVALVLFVLNPILGIVVGVMLVLLLSVIMSTVKTLFISAIYHNVTGDPVELYNQQFIDNLFETKRK